MAVNLDGHMNIRVNAIERDDFVNACKSAGADASTVLRALMNEVHRYGLAFDPDNGTPTIKRRR